MPHDLLWIGERAGLLVDEPLPSWAGDAWIMAAPAVVRREHVATPGLIPVGLRGRTRSERCKAYLRESSVVRRVRPEELVQADFASMYAFLLAFPAVMELGRVAPLLDATGLPWGPTGSVGFALATGLPVLRQASDLDLVVRAAKPLGEKQLSALLALAGLVQCRIDIQIETPFGAFALAEFAAGRTAILLKTDMGPRLTDDPWRPAADGGAAMRKAP
jgi:phosphoribosyl-dephospho-CoA transferase